MQPVSLSQTLEQINALNSEDKAFQYTTTNNQIIGDWKIADIKWSALFSRGTINKSYKLIIDLDEATRTFGYHESTMDSDSKAALNPITGVASFHKSFGSFSGKMTKKQFGMSRGVFIKQEDQEPGSGYDYRFDTKEIKEPLFTVLEQCGWTEKKGLFRKLFGL